MEEGVELAAEEMDNNLLQVPNVDDLYKIADAELEQEQDYSVNRGVKPPEVPDICLGDAKCRSIAPKQCSF